MSRLAAPLILIALIVLMGWLTFSGETEDTPGPASTTNLDPDKGDITIEGLDWAALGTWVRQYVVHDEPGGPLGDLAGLQREIDGFIRHASRAPRADTVAKDSIEGVFEEANVWFRDDRAYGQTRHQTLVMRLVDPAGGPALQRALGPGVLAGIHESLASIEDDLRANMRRARDDLTTATGEERAELEDSLRFGERALAALASIPEPTAEGRAMWERIQASGKPADR